MAVSVFSTAPYLAVFDNVRVPPAPIVFATMDPNNKATFMILSENNLRCVSNSSASWGIANATIGLTTGKYYWEALSLSAATAQGVGITVAGVNMNQYIGGDAFAWGYFPSGAYWTGGVNQGASGGYGLNSILGFALDTAGNFDIYVNGVLGVSITHGFTGPIFPAISDGSTGSVCDFMTNFGQDSSFNGRRTAQGNTDSFGKGDFYYVPPVGYKTLGT